MKLQSLALAYDTVGSEGVQLLDQTQLPHAEVWKTCTSPLEMVGAIERLEVRGAPLIGVAAALALAHWARTAGSLAELNFWGQKLRSARPTAVNLQSAIDRLLFDLPSEGVVEELLSRASRIFEEDVELCDSIANHGSSLINDGDHVMTYCNAGGLATAGLGTALGVIKRAFADGKRLHVFVPETRPLLQGSRLTAWELQKAGIPYTVICDSMVSTVMSKHRIAAAIVGADRIASNGDTANKIGTFALSVQAFYHRVPFYIAAPYTTVDWACASGKWIPIEERSQGEMLKTNSAPAGSKAFNPAFDVTPSGLIRGWILDSGYVEKFSLLKASWRATQKHPAPEHRGPTFPAEAQT